ncbi:MAG: MBOAT family protein [Parasporobacterium sp.]|nr:MBOAT family protein [Parasporobacterium sp.]
MAFTTLAFFLFTAVVITVYFLFPVRKYQWVILLIADYVFYLYAGYKFAVFILFTTVTIYAAARKIESLQLQSKAKLKENSKTWSKDEKKAYKVGVKRRKNTWLVLALVANFGILVFLKYSNFLAGGINQLLGHAADGGPLPMLRLFLPLGISFYTFQAAGYLIDVSRGAVKAEKNLLKFALFISFFPQIVQGPISSFSQLAGQLTAEHKPEFVRFKLGLELILWGYFKKLVIADRAVIAINTLTKDYTQYTGTAILFVALLYALQLYADFSGCMDIVLGVSEMFGIDRPENFRQPFFSRSVAEFWRRWHITLGNWLQDYLYYPVSMCPAAKRFIKNGPGKKKSRIRIVSCLSFFLLWMVMAVWHGPQIGFVFLGIQYAIVFIVTYLLGPTSKRFASNHPKLEENGFWKFFQRARTVILIWPVFLFAPTLSELSASLGRIFTNFQAAKLFQGGLFKFDLDAVQWILLFIGFLTMLIVSNIEVRKEKKITDLVLSQKLPVRILIYWFALIMILLSLSIQNTEFIYAQF